MVQGEAATTTMQAILSITVAVVMVVNTSTTCSARVVVGAATDIGVQAGTGDVVVVAVSST